MGKYRIVILADSLAMPRVEDGVSFEDTYTYSIAKALPEAEVLCRAVRANTSRKQSSEQSIYDDLVVFNPDIVIVQLGIVDCAPRLFSIRQAFVVSKLPRVIRSFLVRFFSKNRHFFTKYLPKVYVSKSDFERHINSLFQEVVGLDSKLVCVSIAGTTSDNIKRSYNISKNIIDYNKVLQKSCKEFGCNYLDFYEKTSDGTFMLADGIHINPQGHKYIADQLLSLIFPVVERVCLSPLLKES